jgi:hypothetical protein
MISSFNVCVTWVVLLARLFNSLGQVEAFSYTNAWTRSFYQLSRDGSFASKFAVFSSPETASETSPPSKLTILLPQKVIINGATPQQSKFPSRFSIHVSNMMDRMRQVSNVASFLCLLDCTILPIVTVALPLLGIFTVGSSQLEFFHELGHSLALYFVLPVGSVTMVTNYLSHRKTWIATLAMMGLLLVGLANYSSHHPPPLLLGSTSLSWLGHVLHTIQHDGPWHRVVNISGCALLLGSNYLSQQRGCDHPYHNNCDRREGLGTSSESSSSVAGSSSCSHDHSHDEHDP